MTVDVDGDRNADWILGMDNQALAGDHRAWLTELTTGTTEEKIGPPYGDPFNSWCPGESVDTRGIITLDIVEHDEWGTAQLYA